MSFQFVECLEGRRLFVSGLIPAVAGPSGSVATVMPATVTQRRVYLTGNSLTDGINYSGLAALLARGGATVTLGRQTGSGYSEWANRTLYPGYLTSGIDPARPADANPWGNYQSAFAAAPWDVLTIQPHDRRLGRDVYDPGTATEHDEAELPNAMGFLRTMAANNAHGQVFVYSRPSRRTDITATGAATGLPFDYSTEWLKPYDDFAEHNLPYFSRSAVRQFLPMLRSAQADDAATAALPPVKLIPVGEAYYNIDQALKAGKFAGTTVTSIYDLYRDQSHPTADVAAYVIALTFYASITGQDPRGVAPPSQYLSTGSKLNDPAVQSLLQQAVYDAMTLPAYAGYTTALPTMPPTGHTASLSGFTFNDANRNGVFDAGDSRAAGKTVFLDADNDGALDAGETKNVTDGSGNFTFSSLDAGVYHVRRVFPSGYAATTPAANPTIADGQALSGLSIGSATSPVTPPPPPPPPPSAVTAVFRGYVINDKNADGKWGSGEIGIAGRTVWIDLDNDGKLDTGEPTRVTSSNGQFEFTQRPAGTIVVREILPAGARQTSPTQNAPLKATLTSGQIKSGQYFAVK